MKEGQETTPQEYRARARRIIDAVERFRKLRRRLYLSFAAPTDEERAKGIKSKKEKVDLAIEVAFARLNTEPTQKVLEKTQFGKAIDLARLVYLMNRIRDVAPPTQDEIDMEGE